MADLLSSGLGKTPALLHPTLFAPNFTTTIHPSFPPIPFVINIRSYYRRKATIREPPGSLFALFVRQSQSFSPTDAWSGQKPNLPPAIQVLSSNTSIPSTKRSTLTGCCGLDLMVHTGCHSYVLRWVCICVVVHMHWWVDELQCI